MGLSSTSEPGREATATTGPEAVLERLLADIRACRVCVETPAGAPLPHAPRPVLCVSATARLAIFGQAPGTRVHASGVPFSDPSGVRLRQWMAIDEATFYDQSRIAILPMGFCFPGLTPSGGDRPPRRECAPRWRRQVLDAMPRLDLALLVGSYAHAWHLGHDGQAVSLTERVRAWRQITSRAARPRLFPLPHPSWRNNAWLAANPWFADEVLPELRREIALTLAG